MSTTDGVNNVFNWQEFGAFQHASVSEERTLRAVDGDHDHEYATTPSDAGREMYAPTHRPHLVLRRQLTTFTYFQFILGRWRSNLERRMQPEPHDELATGFATSGVIFTWLTRLEACATVRCVHAPGEEPASPPHRCLPSDVFERLRRIFRLVVYAANVFNARHGAAFLSTSTTHLPPFYVPHAFDALLARRHFMVTKRKEMTHADAESSSLTDTKRTRLVTRENYAWR